MVLNLWEGITDPQRNIMESALKVFSQNGYDKASTREIARQAGVANGLVFYHFKDKQTLFSELARHLRGIVAKELKNRQNVTGDFYNWIESFVEQKLNLYSCYPEVYQFFMLQIQQFPKQFDEDSKEVRTLYPIWPEADGILAHEILQSALNGMTSKLIENIQMGIISSDSFVDMGMKKTKAFIEFFKKL